MRVQVRKCRFTGKIFEEKDLKKYVIHLQNLRAERAKKRKLDKVRSTFTTWLNREKKNILHPEDIPAWFLKNQRKIMDAVNAGFGDRDEKFYSTDEFTKFSFNSPKFSNFTSNTHVCPNGGILNWACKDDKPKGYPGWSAYVTGQLKRNKSHDWKYPYAAALNAVGLKTGSGGGGNDSWGFGISIFLADWPGLQHTRNELEQEQIVAIPKGNK